MCHRRKVETPPPPPVLEPVEVGRLRRRSCSSTTGPTPRSLRSWPSRGRSTTSHRAGCSMDLVEHMNC